MSSTLTMETHLTDPLLLETTPMEPCEFKKRALLQVTLTGPALIMTLLAMVLSIHLLQANVATILILLAPIPCIISNDYASFLSLGPGGTSSTFMGYLKITYLRLFSLPESQVFRAAETIGPISPSVGHLTSNCIPTRKGSRPDVSGLAPHRQTSQIGCPNSHLLLRRALHRVATRNPTLLRVDVSCFEKKGLALFARSPVNATCRGEVCHVHHSEGSLHMNLHPADAAIVLAHGWGQRHPLAQGGWMTRYVPREFVLVYAPRNEAEVEVVARIVEAAVWWVAGEKVCIQRED